MSISKRFLSMKRSLAIIPSPPFFLKSPQAFEDLGKMRQIALTLPEGAKGTGLGLMKKPDDKKDSKEKKKK